MTQGMVTQSRGSEKLCSPKINQGKTPESTENTPQEQNHSQLIEALVVCRNNPDKEREFKECARLLTRCRCFDNLYGCLLERPHPIQCEPGTLALLFAIVINNVLRSDDFYDSELAKLPTDARKSAEEILQKTKSFFTEIDLQPAPISIAQTKFPIALCVEDGRVFSLLLQDQTWQRIDLLGKFFDSNMTDIKSFYLKYGSYMLYLDSRGQVLRKDLRSDEQPELMVENCKQLLVRESYVFARIVSGDNTSCDIKQWIDDDQTFQSVLSVPMKSDIDFSPEWNLLAFVSEDSVVTTVTLSNVETGTVRLENHSAAEKIQFYNDILCVLKNGSDLYTVARCYSKLAADVLIDFKHDTQIVASRLIRQESDGATRIMSELDLYSLNGLRF